MMMFDDVNSELQMSEREDRLLCVFRILEAVQVVSVGCRLSSYFPDRPSVFAAVGGVGGVEWYGVMRGSALKCAVLWCREERIRSIQIEN